jgi:curved DNA-binding protein CbpA
MGPDFYAILGVAPASDGVVIRAAYKALMFKFHPDRNATADAERRAQAINEAFTVLGDARRRATYDAQRAADARMRMGAPPPWPGPPPRRPPPRGFAGGAPMRGGPPMRAPWRRLAQIRLPYWVTTRRVTAVGGTISLAVAVHLATIAFAPAGLFVSSPVRASTGGDASGGSANAATNDALNLMPAPDVSFDDVEQGAADFAHAYAEGGMAAARLASQRCHAAIDTRPSWRAADRCAAFDLSANAYDDAVSESRGGRGDTYFLFTGRNPAALYNPLSSDALMLEMRVSRIMQAALPALQQAMWPDRRSTGTRRLAAGQDGGSAGPAGPHPGYWSGKPQTP